MSTFYTFPTSSRAYPGILTITDDLASHTIALKAIAEALAIHERRTKDLRNSFVRVGELVDLGLIYENGSQFNTIDDRFFLTFGSEVRASSTINEVPTTIIERSLKIVRQEGPNVALFAWGAAVSGTPAAVVNGANLGEYRFGGSFGTGGNDQSYTAVVRGNATENWTSTAKGSSLSFLCQAIGTTGNGSEMARIDASTTAGHTRFMIYDVDNATLERVTVGVADSGGAGFKLLRIPN